MAGTKAGAATGRRSLLQGPLGPRLATLGLLLAAVSLALPWYSIDNSISLTHSPLVQYSLTQESRLDSDGTTRITPYDIDACHCPAVARAFGLSQVLMWTGTVIAVAAFWLQQTKWRVPINAQFALMLVAGVLLAAGPILLALNSPAAFLSDGKRVSNVVPIGRWGAGFWGWYPENQVQTTSWGPAAGWFAALAAGALTLAGASRRRPPQAADAARSAAPARSTAQHPSAPPAVPMPVDFARGGPPPDSRENAFVLPEG